MNQSQRVLMAGTGISGIAAAKLVLERGRDVVLYDGNAALKEEDIKEKFDGDAKVTVVLGEVKRPDLLGVELCIISPDIPLDSPFVAVVDDAKIPILGEIELIYQYGLGKLAVITGTNEKATVTALTRKVLKARYEETSVVGNIGDPYTSKVLEVTEGSVTVTEASNFQLKTVMDFKSNVSAILNVVPDHLNHHGTMKNYIHIRECVTLNQTKEDAVVFDYDDPVLREFGQNPELKPRVIWFSSREMLKGGFYMGGDNVVYCQNGHQAVMVNVHNMQLLGRHDYENAMATTVIALEMGVPTSDITRIVKGFHPVEHRIEFIRERTGVKYYNDSESANPGATIQALRAMPGPALLIASGYDRNSEYDEWVSEFEGKVRYLVLIRQTRDKIAECTRERGFTEIMYAEDIQEAVQVCVAYADIGDYMLLGPACASWGMFRNYEERGRVFKECVMALQEVNAYGGKGTGGSRTLRPGETSSRERGAYEAADTKEKEEGQAFL